MPNQTVSSDEEIAVDNPVSLKRNNSIPEIPKQKEENNDDVVEKLKELAVHLALTN